MREIEVKIAPRYIKRKSSNAVGKSFLKTLTEPITNSDDSYRILSSQNNIKEPYLITIYIDKRTRLVKIIDNAEGMSAYELENRFKEYGAAKSGAYKGYGTRGLFGQGVSDVLFYHSKGCIKSIKNGEASICSFYEKRNKRFIKVEKQNEAIEKFSQKWNINSDHGTLVEFILDNDTLIYDYENLIKKISTFWMLRLINANETRKISLIYIDTKGTKRKSGIRYYFPNGNLVEHKEFTMPFENYNPVKIDVELYKSDELLNTGGEEKENGLLVFDDQESVYDLTFFGLDNSLGADTFYGFMKLTGAREIILDKINNKKHPEEILMDSRDGFNKQHEFYKSLEMIIRDWLYPILNKERKRSNSGLSETTKENHRKAFEELNKLYSQLTGEDTAGTIRTIKKHGRPIGGMDFARNHISITATKRYGLQLIIDTRVIKLGSIIKLKSHKNKIGFAPTQLTVTKPGEKTDGILIKTITISGSIPKTADTLEAIFGQYYASVVVSIVGEDVFYPENGLGFHPDYLRAIVSRDTTLNLYIDLELIKSGNKIKFVSSNNSIKLQNTELLVPKRLRSTSRVTRLLVPFVGDKNKETGIISANYKNYLAQARIDIQERISLKPTGPTGKFKDWDFDEKVPKPFQSIYDSIQGSPTQGYILINPKHPINEKYFGENPTKADIEKSLIAQLYLAEIILSESLNVTIPEAIQKGTLPKRSDYDILFYIAEKKHEYGPIIYKYFIEEQTKREIKLNKQLELVSKDTSFSDQDLTLGLKEREKQMIEMRFGLNDERPRTLDEIGRKFNLTRERVRQVINNCIAKKYGDYSYSEKYDYITDQEKQIGTNLDKIMRVVAGFYGLEISDLKEKTRRKTIMRPRQIAIYLIRSLMGFSFSSIGKIFNMDHTTILYAFETITDIMEKDLILKTQIESIKNCIKK